MVLFYYFQNRYKIYFCNTKNGTVTLIFSFKNDFSNTNIHFQNKKKKHKIFGLIDFGAYLLPQLTIIYLNLLQTDYTYLTHLQYLTNYDETVFPKFSKYSRRSFKLLRGQSLLYVLISDLLLFPFFSGDGIIFSDVAASAVCDEFARLNKLRAVRL